MNKHIKTFLQYGAIAACLSISNLSHADMSQVMALVNDPSTAPVVKRCEGNVNCNAFVAISKQWQIIPKDDPLRFFMAECPFKARMG